MRSLLKFAAIVTCLSLSSTLAFAQGKGNGLNRALGGAAKGSSSAARAGSNLTRGSQGLTRSAPGLSRMGSRPIAPAGNMPVTDAESLGNQQRILDKRFQQAEHLRGVSERNGNERLLETADRMDSSAVRNFERQTGTTYQPPVPEGGTEGTAEGTAEGTPVPVAPVQTTIQPRKPQGWWFKSR